MTTQHSDTKHLFVIQYDDDAERKRAEYLFKNWSDGKITKPDGLVRIADDVDHEELYERLLSKIPEQNISVYDIESVDSDVETTTEVVEQNVHATEDAVETFLEYILSKKKAVLQSATHNEYELYTKKGRADVSYSITASTDGVDVSVRIVGYSPAPNFLAQFFATELAEYANSQQK